MHDRNAAGTLSSSLEIDLVTNTFILGEKLVIAGLWGCSDSFFLAGIFLQVVQGEARGSNFSCSLTCSVGKEKTLPSDLTA